MILSADLFAALVAFAFVSSITPGPNNLMLLASGVNFGIRRTVPHMLGIECGVVLTVTLVGLGFGQVLAVAPWSLGAIKLAGVAYMLWLAWKIAQSGRIGEGRTGARPMTFLQAAAFQLVNPKAWAMTVTAVAAYTMADRFLSSVVVVALVFGAVSLPSVSVWAMFGVWLRRYLDDPGVVLWFNRGMALLLVASLWPVAADALARYG